MQGDGSGGPQSGSSGHEGPVEGWSHARVIEVAKYAAKRLLVLVVAMGLFVEPVVVFARDGSHVLKAVVAGGAPLAATLHHYATSETDGVRALVRERGRHIVVGTVVVAFVVAAVLGVGYMLA